MSIWHHTGGPTAILLLGYNLPERTLELANHIVGNTQSEYDLIVLDNGSTQPFDQLPSTKHIRLPENVYPGGAYSVFFSYAQALAAARNRPFFAYWLVQTNNYFTQSRDYLAPLVHKLVTCEKAVAVANAYTPDSQTNYTHLRQRSGNGYRRTWTLDASVCFRAAWYDAQPLMDPRLTLGWGRDLELSYLARTQGYELYVNDGLAFEYRPKSVAVAGVGGYTPVTWSRRGRAEMDRVFIPKYGSNWRAKLCSAANSPDLS